MANAQEGFEEAVGELVGDNVGRNCDCSGCEKNRAEMREAVEALIAERTAKLQARIDDLEAAWPTAEYPLPPK